MWANAQRDGRPAKYRWRRLFNAAKLTDAHYCRAVTLPIRKKPVEISWGAPNYRTDLSRYSGPKFSILCGHVEEILLLLLNRFSHCRYVS